MAEKKFAEAQAKAAKAAKSATLGGEQVEINREFQEKAALSRAKELNLPYINVGKTVLNPDFLKLVSYKDAESGRIIPFFRLGNKVRVAVEDTEKAETKEIVKKLEGKGFKVSMNLASGPGVDEALVQMAKIKKYKKPKIVEGAGKEKIKTYEKEIAELKDLPKKVEKVTAEEGLNMLNVGAIRTKASDIHYEPTETAVVVRFRIDGILHKVFELSLDSYNKISKQIKYNSKMQLNVITVPQDGRYDFEFNERKVDVRVSSIPTPYGESIVCRFLVSEEKAFNFEELGFREVALKKLEHASKISHGMILVTGPTGSGKTTTLYTILDKMKLKTNKIITLEDPVEYHIDGVTQSQIDEKNGYNFASGLRSLLRQDPDVVMLGEIRDLETAETAAQAALTGHVLLSTLHTNSAIESIPRLVNMGLPAFMVAPALDTIVAQRLVRRVCPDCSTKEPITESESREYEELIENLKNVNPKAVIDIPKELPKVHACDKCSQTGYQGRLVVAEVITVGQQMKRLILENASSVDLISLARKEGMLTMREDGFLKAAQGLTTLEEVHRVTNVSI